MSPSNGSILNPLRCLFPTCRDSGSYIWSPTLFLQVRISPTVAGQLAYERTKVYYLHFHESTEK